MINRELNRHLKKRILRSIGKEIVPLAGTNRLPRYRVHIPSDAKDLLVGQTLNNIYYVLSVLGHGGMSVVYKGKMLTKKRIVAVKTLRVAGTGDDLIVKRFQREAELLLHLNHPRIVQVHEHGYTRRGQPYFVMDYLTGVNLSDVIKKHGPLPPDRVRHIFSQVCGAVDHAHRCGVIHRDLKPGNIMLLQEGQERDFVKVVDFGIARFEEEAQRLTRLGEVWGSPIYMSPEQCMGAQLDARSDIYSIGIALYESLTGQVPFLGKNYVDTMSKQIGEPPRPLNEVAPNIKVSDRLEKVVMRALAKEPEKRYQTMSELREDLENAFATPSTSHQRISQQKLSQQKLSQQKLSQQKAPQQKLSNQPPKASKQDIQKPSKQDLQKPSKQEIQKLSKQDLPKQSRSTGEMNQPQVNEQKVSQQRVSSANLPSTSLPPIKGTRASVREVFDRRERQSELINTVVTAVIIFGLLMGVVFFGQRWMSTVNSVPDSPVSSPENGSNYR